jgi:hypothetical protein|tara:strand:- start:620 stop:817 length:198 start_codon:yes stop_codon:yes gene_type:complete
MREVELGEILTENQLNAVKGFLENNDLKGLRRYLNIKGVRDHLEKKGVLSDYLYYYLEHILRGGK